MNLSAFIFGDRLMIALPRIMEVENGSLEDEFCLWRGHVHPFSSIYTPVI